jgi:alpha-L-fucosidase 2
MKSVWFVCFLLWPLLVSSQATPEYNLQFDSLASRWDEAIPLGNGWLGALIWQKENKLRLSLDRVDLWDDRPMPEIDKLRFKWVVEKVKLNQYDSVQKIGDEPYEKYPAPTKIPAAALEFDLKKLGKVVSNTLHIKTGLSVIKFDNGIVFNNYIHAVNQVGYFGFENMPAGIIPELIMPAYQSEEAGGTGNSVEGQGLDRLGYKKGTRSTTHTSIRYHQPTWQNNYYEVLVKWTFLPGRKIIGQWTISNNQPAVLPIINMKLKEPTYWPAHVAWWNDYWTRSSVALPDTLLERQYYLEMYKFACVARSNTPPISLQAIWTADNGKLPPWKGDYHHDLNTQLSYWPGYTGNHLDLTAGYTNWLWKVKQENERWTREYFELDGLNVPGVTTISGKPMGGWIQYSMSPTTAAWLSQHFYWQWKYTMDNSFLKERANPYILEVRKFIDQLQKSNKTNRLPLSSSPEYHNNAITAWFANSTNYDLALLNSLDQNGYSLFYRATKLKHKSFTTPWHWRQNQQKFDTNQTGLSIAPGQNLDESHRHHAHLMAIHPLGLLNREDSTENEIIQKSLRHLEKTGTSGWCGYSFSWAACIYARAQEADNAVKHLQIFANNFCSSNSFHLNGDQKGGQYSSYTYRPFTLEGNFAFAQGVHELLLQSHKGFIEVFPAVPISWKNVSFTTLRTEGAFLVSARKTNGVAEELKIISTAGGLLRIKVPFKTWATTGISTNLIREEGGIAEMITHKGQIIIFKNGYE